MTERNEITQRAIDKAGGPVKIAAVLDIGKSNISMWVRIPTKWVSRISDMTGIPKHELRPDKPKEFPPPEEAAA